LPCCYVTNFAKVPSVIILNFDLILDLCLDSILKSQNDVRQLAWLPI